MSQLSTILYCVVIFGVVAGQCLVALWAATSTRPRALRALVVWVAIVLLMAIRAYVPALVFTMTAGWTFVLIAAIRHRVIGQAGATGRPTERWRFQLADIFVVVLFVATVFALGRYLHFASWGQYAVLPLLGLPLAPVVAFAHLSVTGPARPRMIAATFVAILASAAMLPWFGIGQGFLIRLGNRLLAREEAFAHLLLLACLVGCAVLVAWLGRKLWKQPAAWPARLAYAFGLCVVGAIGILVVERCIDDLWRWGVPELPRLLLPVATASLPIVGLAAVAAGATWLARVPWASAAPARRRFAQGFGFAAGASVLALAGWLYWQMLWPPTFPPPPRLGGPNHYDRIVEICRLLTGPYGQLHAEKVPAHLQSLVDEAVDLLDAPNVVPTPALEQETQNYGSPEMLRGFDVMALSDMLAAATNDAQRRLEFDRAADCALAGIRFGEIFWRGGTSSQASLGDHVQFRHLDWLAQHRLLVSRAKASEIASVLEQLPAMRDDLATLAVRDVVDWKRRGGWQGRLRSILTFSRPNNDSGERLLSGHLHNEAIQRSVLTVYAIRSYQEDRGRLPKDLAELVPDYLHRVPTDPYSDGPLVYRPAVIDFVLYSVGYDRVDDGGNFSSALYGAQKGFDLDLSWANRR